MSEPRRSPLRVALLTFGAVVVVGMIASLGILVASGNLHDHPNERGQAIGRGLAFLGVAAAAGAYLIQRGRLKR